MLARISCNCKIMVFSHLKLEVTYYHSSKAIKPSMSNSLLLPTKSMVARGNQ